MSDVAEQEIEREVARFALAVARHEAAALLPELQARLHRPPGEAGDG